MGAVRIIRLSTTLPNTPEGRFIRNQITKSGTSIGANYREANRARSKADFKNKIKICESEASLPNGIRSLFLRGETQYWIEVILEIKWLSREEANTDYEECSACPTSILAGITCDFYIYWSKVTLDHFSTL